MKPIWTIVMAVVIAILVFLLLRSCERPVDPIDPEIIRNAVVDSITTEVIAPLHEAALQREMEMEYQDSIKDARIAALTRQIKNIRPRAEILIIDGSAADSLVEYQDSVMVEQRVHIAYQDRTMEKWRKDFYQLDSAYEFIRHTMDTSITNLNAKLITKTKEVAEEKSKVFSVGPYIGYGYGPQGGQPTIGVSVQYRLFKFKLKK